jgi:phosphatidylglycerophosphate synthase
VTHNGWRLAIVAAAAATDLLDGPIARRRGSSAYGAVLDPIADKVFMAAAVGVVALSGALEPYEIAGVLLRDIVATIAFAATFFSDEPKAIPARWSGKAVTVAQILTLIAFLLHSEYLRPIAWATTVIAVFSIVDYLRVAPRAQRRLGR